MKMSKITGVDSNIGHKNAVATLPDALMEVD